MLQALDLFWAGEVETQDVICIWSAGCSLSLFNRIHKPNLNCTSCVLTLWSSASQFYNNEFTLVTK